MFDLGFSELMVIGVVALIVIGPERLPRMARTVGHLAGRLQRYVSDVKADINREIELDELRKMRDSMQQAASNFESTVQSEVSKTQTDLDKSVEELNKAVETPPVDWREAESKPAEGSSPPEKKPEEKKPA
jgi:sec-independent protein translocase protein TatB